MRRPHTAKRNENLRTPFKSGIRRRIATYSILLYPVLVRYRHNEHDLVAFVFCCIPRKPSIEQNDHNSYESSNVVTIETFCGKQKSKSARLLWIPCFKFTQREKECVVTLLLTLNKFARRGFGKCNTGRRRLDAVQLIDDVCRASSKYFTFGLNIVMYRITKTF